MQVMERTGIGRIEILNEMTPEKIIYLVLDSRERLAEIERRKRVPEARETVEVKVSCEIGS